MKQFVVIGCGRFGKTLAITLTELGNEVLVIDNNEDTVNELSTVVTHAVCADITQEGTLHALGVQNFDVVIVSISSNFEASLLATVSAKSLGVKKVITKVKDDLHGKIVEKVGADKVIIPERDTGLRLAHSLTSSKIVDFIEVSKDFSMIEIHSPKEWYHQSLKGLDIRGRFGLNIVAVKSEGNSVINPRPEYEIQPNDILLVVGKNIDIEKLAIEADE